MFDQLFKRASTRARYVTAPFAEERARYLDYCELRGDSRSQQLRKAHDLLWIARKLNSHSELQVTSDQIRALVVNGQHDGDDGRPNLNGSGAIPDKWMFVWQNDFLGSMPPRSPPRALERSLLFWSAV